MDGDLALVFVLVFALAVFLFMVDRGEKK